MKKPGEEAEVNWKKMASGQNKKLKKLRHFEEINTAGYNRV